MKDIKSVSFGFRRDAWTGDMNVDTIGVCWSWLLQALKS